MDIRSEIKALLVQSISDDYVGYIMTDEFVEEVTDDVEECSSWKDEGCYNDDDIRLAIGRVMLKKMKIDY